MRFLRVFMNLFQRAQEEPGLPLRRPATAWTCILFRFTDGTSRSFVFDRRYLEGKALQDALDPLLDEMKGAEFDGPVEICRSRDGGGLDYEIVGLLTPEES